MKKIILILIISTFVISGCATVKENRGYCIATGAIVGGVIGGVAEDDNEADVAIGGALIGGVIGWLICDSDKDGDGVSDDIDQCPTTRKGASVDNRGCELDSDGDGVPDGLDKCPGTERGMKVDANGCVRDRDGDGVSDGMDQCPRSPAGVKVDSRGCVPDSDMDGITDSSDQCPDTPEGRTVNKDGCELDRDGDGVVDGADDCPNTPAGQSVNQDGCRTLFSLSGANFATNSSELSNQGVAQLSEVAATLIQNSQIEISVNGYTDSRGNEAYNQRLSEARASSVRDYLVSQGVDSDRMRIRGYGESSPISSNSTAEGRAQNRRVALVITKS